MVRRWLLLLADENRAAGRSDHQDFPIGRVTRMKDDPIAWTSSTSHPAKYEKNRTHLSAILRGVILSAAMITAVFQISYFLQQYMVKGAEQIRQWQVAFLDTNAFLLKSKLRTGCSKTTTYTNTWLWSAWGEGKIPISPIYLWLASINRPLTHTTS